MTATPPVAPFDLTGRVAFVTGAGSGIGRATAIRLAQAGAIVHCADLNAATAQETVEQVGATGGRARAVALDVTDQSQVFEVISAIDDLDILCNIAGIIANRSVADLTEAEFDRIFAVNVKGSLYCIQAALPAMRAHRRGAIVNTASTAIDLPTRHLSAYAMSKASVTQLTRSVAAENGEVGIRANTVVPGLTDTNLIARHFTNDGGEVDEALREAYLKPNRDRTPLGVIIEPDDVALAIWFLVADASRFITGQVLRTNGGLFMA